MAQKKAPRLGRPLLDQLGAVAYTGLSLRWFRRRIEEGTLPIPIVKVGGRNYFNPDDLDRLVDQLPRVMRNETLLRDEALRTRQR